jgi:hypothetical protein
VKVEQFARELEERDERYMPFARRVQELAHAFDEDELVVFLKRCLESHRDAVSH